MIKVLKLWEKWSTHGLHLPFMHDPRTQKPSITLLFPYITFVSMMLSLIALHFKTSLIIATSTTVFVWIMSVIFYMLRKIHSAKINLEEKSFELEGEDEDA